MKLNKTDYVLERASDGGYYAWLTVNMQCNAYGESPEEAVQKVISFKINGPVTILLENDLPDNYNL